MLAHKFRQICRHSDDFLREYIFKDISEEEEKPIVEEKPAHIYEQVEVEVLEEGAWCNEELIEEAPVPTVPAPIVEQSSQIVVPVTTHIVAGKSHVCEICGNSYPRKSTLDTHMRRHNNERPYQCE